MDNDLRAIVAEKFGDDPGVPDTQTPFEAGSVGGDKYGPAYGKRTPDSYDITALAALVGAMSQHARVDWPDTFMSRVGHVLDAYAAQFRSSAD
jgi:hypothetical protein